jgi:hypothetical protein
MKLSRSDLRTLQFDDSSNDYEVVMIRRNNSKECSDFVIYILETIHSTIDVDIRKSSWVLFNGVVHCLKSKKGKGTLFVFNLRIEESYELSLLISSAHGTDDRRNLLILDGCLCVDSFGKQEGGYYNVKCHERI